MDLLSIRSLFTPSVLFLLLNLVIATIAVISTRHRHHRGGDPHQQQQQQHPRPIARSSSSNVLERVRSLGLFRFRSGDLPPIAAADPPQEEQQEPIEHQQPQQFRRIHSESESQAKEKISSASKTMGKSASAMTWRSSAEVYAEIKRRPAAVRRDAAAADEEVDAKADDFINRFRQQLKLQRLDSLLRYKEMLKAK